MGGVGFLEIFGRPQMNLAGIRSSSWVAGTGATHYGSVVLDRLSAVKKMD